MSLIQSIVIPKSYLNAKCHYEIDVYRGDLEDVRAPGNKFHKLKYHLLEAKRCGATHIATFGGPFSNHLHAFGLSLETMAFQGICVVRGELHPQLTPTLKDIKSAGCELWPSSRLDYKQGLNSHVAKQINDLYKKVYWVPEGGGGVLGAKGCLDWASDIDYLAGEYDAWLVSSGTGTTASGLLAYANVPFLAIVSALKGEGNQQSDIKEMAQKLADINGLSSIDTNKLRFYSNAHEGGYARHSKALLTFLNDFAIDNKAKPLDPIYTSKTLYFVLQQMSEGLWPHKRTLLIHTGGLQGWRGYSHDFNPFM